MTAPSGALFTDPLHEDFSLWPLAYTSVGGIERGEVIRIAAAVEAGGGDDSAFFDAWFGAGERVTKDADAALAAGHVPSARALLLRAAALYATAYKPLFGAPVDPRLVRGYRAQIDAFERALELLEHPVRRIGIPFEGGELPAYFLPAEGRADEVRPTIVFTNGYDGTITDLYFASAAAATRRGYHALIFDGPGQGEMLYLRGIPLRADWEVVVSAVVDHALTIPTVDPQRIALSGWSLGGYLAPRAATGEGRLAACIADPGQLDLGSAVSGFLRSFGIDTDAPGFTVAGIDDESLAEGEAALRANRRTNWSIIQRGYWANGVSDLRAFIEKTMTFTFRDRVDRITCPVLITAAENDPLAAQARELHDLLPGRKEFLQFSAAEGAGGHCEMGNRSLLNLRVLDWLDDVLA
jgi:hypothetical protein